MIIVNTIHINVIIIVFKLLAIVEYYSIPIPEYKYLSNTANII